MHYYKRNIGDYHRKAGRLSMLEHGAYTLLMDACYDRERFPTKEEALAWCWARTDEEVVAVDFVLSRFFRFEGGLYIQPRIQEELSGYAENRLINKRIAQEREESRRLKKPEKSTNRTRTVHEPPPNQEPLTNNQKPITNKPRTRNKKEGGALAPDFSLMFSQLWESWPSAFGEKGSRKNAEKAFCKMRPSPDLFAQMSSALEAQIADKSARTMSGEFCPNFPHVERWLKNQRWQDEISKRPVKQRPIDKAEAAADAVFGPSLNGAIEGHFDRIDEDGLVGESIPAGLPHLGGRPD